MVTRSGKGAIYTRASWVLGVVLFFCAAQQAAALPLDPSYGANVALDNFGHHFYEGQTAAEGNVVTGAGAPQITEGAADFGAIPSIEVKVTGGPASQGIARALLFDTLTFHVAGGGSAQVPVRIAGRWGGTDSSDVEFALFLGLLEFRGRASASGLFDSAFTRFGDPITGVTGVYLFDTLWSVSDGGVYSIGAQVMAVAGGGANAYIDDPLTIDLPAGVTFTSASTSTYAPAPEPSTSWLLLCGGIAAFALRPRRSGAASR